MKAQHTIKIAKKTVFVYKTVKAKNNFVTDPTSATAETMLPSTDIFNK
ncbi:hypothetical protein [Pedobacter sp. MW01-1-1]